MTHLCWTAKANYLHDINQVNGKHPFTRELEKNVDLYAKDDAIISFDTG